MTEHPRLRPRPPGRRLPWWALGTGAVVGALVAVVVLLAVVGVPGPTPAPRPSAAATTPAARPSVVFLGDSWTEGIGATGLRGYAVLTAEQLDWNYQVLGVGGSGYLAPGRGSVFEQRIEEAVHGHPDVIVVQGSLNDRTGTSAQLQTAALHMLSRLRAEAGRKTRILVVGASYTPTWGPSTIDPINAAVSDAAAQVGLRFVDPAREEWTDPEDRAIWADGNHPNDAGHQLVADHLEAILVGLVRR